VVKPASPPGGDGDTHSINVPHDAVGARHARQRLAAELELLVPATLRADVIAVAAELLGNAVRHASALPGDVIALRWRVDTDDSGTLVELQVCDGGSTLEPRAGMAEPDAVGGRGLAIVSALSRTWGYERGAAGQCVWARLRGPTLSP